MTAFLELRKKKLIAEKEYKYFTNKFKKASNLGKFLPRRKSSQNTQKAVQCTGSSSNFKLWHVYGEGFKFSR